jgi:hypothetical protein
MKQETKPKKEIMRESKKEERGEDRHPKRENTRMLQLLIHGHDI